MILDAQTETQGNSQTRFLLPVPGLPPCLIEEVVSSAPRSTNSPYRTFRTGFPASKRTPKRRGMVGCPRRKPVHSCFEPCGNRQHPPTCLVFGSLLGQMDGAASIVFRGLLRKHTCHYTSFNSRTRAKPRTACCSFHKGSYNSLLTVVGFSKAFSFSMPGSSLA